MPYPFDFFKSLERLLQEIPVLRSFEGVNPEFTDLRRAPALSDRFRAYAVNYTAAAIGAPIFRPLIFILYLVLPKKRRGRKQ